MGVCECGSCPQRRRAFSLLVGVAIHQSINHSIVRHSINKLDHPPTNHTRYRYETMTLWYYFHTSSHRQPAINSVEVIGLLLITCPCPLVVEVTTHSSSSVLFRWTLPPTKKEGMLGERNVVGEARRTAYTMLSMSRINSLMA